MAGPWGPFRPTRKPDSLLECNLPAWPSQIFRISHRVLTTFLSI